MHMSIYKNNFKNGKPDPGLEKIFPFLTAK
jgi:hypothetical protein